MKSDQPFRFDAPDNGNLSQEMRGAFHREGVLVLEGFVDANEIAALRKATDRLVDQFDPESIRTVFSTEDQSHASEDYFRGSGDKIRYFFEVGAFDAEGNLTRDKHRALNKIGHAMHDLDENFSRFSRAEKLANVARSLSIKKPGLAQSMLIFKQPEIGGKVGMHQDATFLYTSPQSVVGFWFALEDATTENGCLFGLPGLQGRKLNQRFHYDGDELITEQLAEQEMPITDAVPLEAPAGTLVVLHGLFPHASHPNLSSKSRQAYALHVVDQATEWAPDNWLRRATDMPLRGF